MEHVLTSPPTGHRCLTCLSTITLSSANQRRSALGAARASAHRQQRFQKPSQIIQCRGFILPQSSLKELAYEQLAYKTDETDEEWSRLGPSVQKSNTEKQIQDHPHHQKQNPECDAYFGGLSQKEIERRRKIGAANKGKVPWTKGRKWSEEHKELIKQRTTEALRDPKIRKKMLGHRQLHRQASKDKISAALRKIWERRIVSVKSRQKILQIWSNSIAEAAKNGDHSQDKLDWDSYESIKSQMMSVFLWNKERERIIKKLKKAVAKIAAKKLQAAGRRKIQGTHRGTEKLKPNKMQTQKSDAQPTRVVVSTRPKLKEKLTKWHGRKKELETVISSQTRKRGLRKPAQRQMTAEGRRPELQLSRKDGLP